MTTINADLPDEIIEAIESYIQNQPDSPTLPTVVQAALQSFLTTQGYLPTAPKRLRITPASQGSGYRDTSIEHDRVLANLTLEDSD
jgi:hypothetical protein